MKHPPSAAASVPLRVGAAAFAAAWAILGGLPGHAATPARLPNRVLDCRIGHAVNLDTSNAQSERDVRFDTWHHLSLALPDIPARTAAPPDPTDPPEPVDPRTRILADPDGLTADTRGTIDRVVDYWPQRVEVMLPMADGRYKVLLVTDYSESAQQARLTVLSMRDATSIDTAHYYFGACSVATAPTGSPTTHG